jgi:hypothetical protein
MQFVKRILHVVSWLVGYLVGFGRFWLALLGFDLVGFDLVLFWFLFLFWFSLVGFNLVLVRFDWFRFGFGSWLGFGFWLG